MTNGDCFSGLGESTDGSFIPQERENPRRKIVSVAGAGQGGGDAQCHSDLFSLGAYGSLSKGVPDIASCLWVMRLTA